MRKIINRKAYDTETATLIASWGNGRGFRDFSYCSEELYKKKTGEFFLYGEGGPASPYREMVGSRSYTSGKDIIPMSETEAQDWVEKKCSASEYEAIFGEVAE